MEHTERFKGKMTLAPYSTDKRPTKRCINSKPGAGELPVIMVNLTTYKLPLKG